MPRARSVPLLALAVALVAGLTACGDEGGPEMGDTPVDRVLMVSLPGVGWDDVQGADLPNLERFVETAAIGDLSTRIGRASASTTAAYLTLGSGTRAVQPAIDVAVALDPDESYGGVPSAEILERRLGWVPRGITYPAIGAALDANERSAYGAEVGMLGDRLGEAGVDRAVIANADAAEGFVSDEPPPDGAYARGAATALMGSNGIVPGGTVGRSLLVDDPLAPFGRRLDQDVVLDAFAREWRNGDRTVVLVEASDLSRATGYAARTTSEQRRSLRQEALADADALLGRLLESVDPERDAVMVLSPVAPSASPALGIAAVQAPDVHPGLLQSATTRRDGYVQLADVAPTVLSLLGEDPPDEIEGRSFQVGDRSTPGRVERLADSAEAAGFRDSFIMPAVVGIIAVLALLTLGTRERARIGGWRRLLAPVAFGALGFVPATFLVGRIEAVRASTLGHVVGIVALAAVVAAVCVAAERRSRGTGAMVGTGIVVGLVALDVLLGAPLQVNTVFGYSVAVAGRFAGLGNLAFSLFGSATIVLAALIVDRAGRRGLPWAFALLGAVVIVEGLPMLGADVGGVLSMIPAFGVTALILAGRRVGLREGIGLVVATAGIVLTFAFVDAARPPQYHTHLARLAQHLLDGRWGPFFDSLTRRWQASLGGAELAAWITVTAVMVAAGIYAALVASGRAGPVAARARRARDRDRPTSAAAAGLGVLALVGLLANDSSIAVPATMLIVVVPVVVLRTLGGRGASPVPPASSAAGAAAPAPAPVPASAARPAGAGATSSPVPAASAASVTPRPGVSR
jgi:hypothetical protein